MLQGRRSSQFPDFIGVEKVKETQVKIGLYSLTKEVRVP